MTKLAEALGKTTVYTVGDPEPDETNPYGDIHFYDVTADISGIGTSFKRHFGRSAEYSLWEDVDWRIYGSPDVLITSGSTPRAVITPDTTLHVNYCHSPPRWFYDLYHDRKSSLLGQLARPAVRYLRMRDSALDDRVDHYLANSPIISRRLWKYYKRDAEVVYPPVKLNQYENHGDEGFYFHLGRLDVEKGIKAVVDSFEGINKRIVFAGGEGDAGVVDRIQAAENMDYVGFVSEAEKYDLLGRCRAVVFNGRNEDFGIVPIEANASGKPCLARDEGFPGLFIEDGINGYSHNGSPPSIRSAINQLEREGLSGDPESLIGQFSMASFEDQLRATVAEMLGSFQTQFKCQ
ncbi:Glycosyltransferase involved in cell wall bisynthesis [Halobellus limi]|uniref:Glycosyltransferase involved in cell wall bisynthesis n=1 Tax=Halobellus limi TaxID=699433 RepID=A0A1H5UT11_9EURY|nr:Glycosyltransferase involved in cell wall bisynthesis [Halobellus limi]